MSLYNMIHGFNPACVVLMPMLGKKQDEYPRFRDCFVSDDEKNIVIYTRVGGANRDSGYGEEELYKDPNFIRTWDDEEDNTYGFYEFRVPEKWQSDFNLIVAGRHSEVSDEYVNYLCEFYPELKDPLIQKLFRSVE